MSELHAETANWLEGLRGRADRAEERLRAHPADDEDAVHAHRHLRDLRERLDRLEAETDVSHEHRTQIQTMADHLKSALARLVGKG